MKAVALGSRPVTFPLGSPSMSAPSPREKSNITELFTNSTVPLWFGDAAAVHSRPIVPADHAVDHGDAAALVHDAAAASQGIRRPDDDAIDREGTGVADPASGRAASPLDGEPPERERAGVPQAAPWESHVERHALESVSPSISAVTAATSSNIEMGERVPEDTGRAVGSERVDRHVVGDGEPTEQERKQGRDARRELDDVQAGHRVGFLQRRADGEVPPPVRQRPSPITTSPSSNASSTVNVTADANDARKAQLPGRRAPTAASEIAGLAKSSAHRRQRRSTKEVLASRCRDRRPRGGTRLADRRLAARDQPRAASSERALNASCSGAPAAGTAPSNLSD